MKTNIPKDSIELKANKVMSFINIEDQYEIKGDRYNITISLINERKKELI